MTSTVRVAAIQSAIDADRAKNIERMIALLHDAAARGANVALMPELFEGPYFPQQEDEELFKLAAPALDHPTVRAFQTVAKQLNMVLPVSFFEREQQEYYNSVAMIDATGEMLGVYRKSHIPDGPGYEEKFYFRPGNTGFRTWETRHGCIGVGICWDQWFPEAARAMVLSGADILLYPTAIGSEPQAPGMDTKDPWQRVMIGHAVANVCAVVAANRTGTENEITFYGSSFICDDRGDKLAELGRTDEGIIVAEIDIDQLRRQRAGFGLFRDRRPDLYASLARTRNT